MTDKFETPAASRSCPGCGTPEGSEHGTECPWVTTAAEPQFCRYCGAGIGKFRRSGEGTCDRCDSPAAEPPQDVAGALWVVFNGEDVDIAYKHRYQAMEQAGIMAADFPELGPWRVEHLVPAAALESLARERDLLRAQVSNLESAVEYWRAGRDATPT